MDTGPMEPPRKIDALRRAMSAGAWESAIAIAAKFPRLGDEATAIMRAHEAIVRPDFQRQLGRDPEQLKADGIAALKGKYGV
jgi:hypothetical protein